MMIVPPAAASVVPVDIGSIGVARPASVTMRVRSNTLAAEAGCDERDYGTAAASEPSTMYAGVAYANDPPV